MRLTAINIRPMAIHVHAVARPETRISRTARTAAVIWSAIDKTRMRVIPKCGMLTAGLLLYGRKAAAKGTVRVEWVAGRRCMIVVGSGSMDDYSAWLLRGDSWQVSAARPPLASAAIHCISPLDQEGWKEANIRIAVERCVVGLRHFGAAKHAQKMRRSYNINAC